MVNTRATIKKIPMQSGALVVTGDLVVSGDDLLIEIFLRLPLTSVLRFKSVSKHWQSLLSHRIFTLLYKCMSISLGLFIRTLSIRPDDFYIPFDHKNRSSPPFRALDFYPDPFGIRILQSCNGLLLCCSDRGAESDRKYYVFNPTTKQFAIIPSVPGAGDVGTTIYAIGLAFHQTDCAHYKVVCIVKGEERLNRIQIYSSDTGRWKISDQSFYEPYHRFRAGVYWNQAIYWFWHFKYFNLKTEKLQSMPLLPGSCQGARDYFGESRGHLHLVLGSHLRDSLLHVKVYEMLDDHSGWFLKYRVDLDELLNVYPKMIYRVDRDPSILYDSQEFFSDFQVLDVVRGEEEVETFMVIKIPEKVIRYNVADKSYKHIYDLSINHWFRFGDAHRHLATIVSF